ncbi:SidA/IucD/PvdA family monooxygenase, partial [Acinetobacter baumannii]
HQHYRTRQLVLGVGTTPHLPESLQKIYSKSGTCLHSSEYLQYSSQKLSGNVVLIGSGQSAAEIFLDLFDRQYMNGRTTPDFH